MSAEDNPHVVVASRHRVRLLIPMIADPAIARQDLVEVSTLKWEAGSPFHALQPGEMHRGFDGKVYVKMKDNTGLIWSGPYALIVEVKKPDWLITREEKAAAAPEVKTIRPPEPAKVEPLPKKAGRR